MHKLYNLKEMLMEELEKYGDKSEMSPGELAIVDTLAHATKNLCKIIESADEDYSGDYRGMNGSYRGNKSYARRRDSMGRYSSDYSRAADDIIAQLEDMKDTAPDDMTRREIIKLIDKMKHS